MAEIHIRNILQIRRRRPHQLHKFVCIQLFLHDKSISDLFFSTQVKISFTTRAFRELVICHYFNTFEGESADSNKMSIYYWITTQMMRAIFRLRCLYTPPRRLSLITNDDDIYYAISILLIQADIHEHVARTDSFCFHAASRPRQIDAAAPCALSLSGLIYFIRI